MKKIIFKSSVLMIAVFLSVLFIAPAMLYAIPVTINIAAIPGVTIPVTGAAPVSEITATDEYTGTVAWAPADDPFSGGTAYTATITLTAKEGFTLTGVGADFFTVAGADGVANAADSGEVTAVFPATADVVISIAAIPGVTAPVTGAAPVSEITATDEYTGTVAWAPADDPFSGGTVYTATITLTAKAGFTLTGVGADFFTVAEAYGVANAADSGVVIAVFPATAAAPTTPPTTPDYVQQTVGAGTVTVDASSVAGAYAIVTGSGGQTVTIEKISSGAASAGGFSIEGATTYVDLHLDSSEGVEQILFTILGGAGVPRWWNGSSWIECSDYTIDAAGNVTTTITNSTTPSLSDLTGTVFTVVPGSVRTHDMTCWQIYVNEEGNFEFIFWWEYYNNNWVKIYDNSGTEVFSIDMEKGNAHFEADLPDGMYTVKTFHDGFENPIQEFIIGKP